jgi:hypothetical protein
VAKIKIDKHNYLRVMLTETLPYEVPITFLNEGFYFYLRELDKNKKRGCKTEQPIDQFISFFFNYDDYTKPYNYRINKNSTSKRLLSVPHPTIQRKMTDFYKEYDSLITELCSKSPISLRAPFRVASRFYEKELVNYEDRAALGRAEAIETEKDAFEETSIYASSYFTYRKYNFLYKYYDSYESHRIEKKFEHLTRFDISKCFHNIYIPTLSWAVKTKAFSKKYKGAYSFEGKFQKIMQNANDLESSGIIVGPEFSRIFAEIILQDIDLNIIDRLKSELGLHFGSDYTIRRYVDDYFLYTPNSAIPNKVLTLVKDELEKYKLYINESKTEFLNVPFITGLTIAKMDCSLLVRELFKGFNKDPNESESEELHIKLNNPGRESNRFIKNLKRVVKVNDVSYESLSGYTLAEIRRRLFKLLEDDRVVRSIFEGDSTTIQKVMLLVIEISFFVYSMDIRVRTTYIITQLIVRLNDITKNRTAEFKDEIRKKIYDESNLLLSKMLMKDKANSIETLNLLIGIRTNIDDYPINNSKLLDFFNLELTSDDKIKFIKSHNEIGYFQAMVLTGFVRETEPVVTKFLEDYIFNIINSAEDVQHNTELTCMFFDSISCPYFSKEFKIKLILIFLPIFPVELEVENIFTFLSTREWFFTWKDNNLAQVLMKKELRSPY